MHRQPDDTDDMPWQPPADAKIHIVCAANKLGDLVIPGARHFDNIMHGLIDKMGLRGEASNMEQGFIDQFGRFWSREVAMQIVKDHKQKIDLERNGGNDRVLFSEGLY